MTTSNHTPIATGAAANASTFNTPLGSLDAAIGDEATLTTTVKTSVVAAINELDAGKLESGASAALIANTPAGNIAATNVQTAINELDTEKQPLDADLTAIAAISPSNDDVIQRKSGAWTNRTMAELKADLALTAANVANVAAGTIAAVTVQAAIDELDTEKAAASHTHTVSAVTDQSNWKLDNFGTADDNTDLNATTTQHGLLAKLSGAAGYFMDGLGTWARAFVSIMWSGSGNFQAKYINFKGSAVTGVSYNATLDSVDVTITGGSGAGATLLTELTDVNVASPPDDNDVLSYDTASSKWINVAAGAGHTIQDEGVNLTNRNTLNFVGAGVTVADVSLKTTATIPGAIGDPNTYVNNAIINGNFVIAQRGNTFTSATVPANSDDTYLLDRWVLLSDGNDIVDVSQETTVVPTGSAATIKIDIETEDKKWGLLQIIEEKDSKALIGGNVSLSFKAARGAGDTNTLLRAGVLSWSSTADVVTSDVVDAWGNEGDNPTIVANWTFENVPAALAELTDAWQTYKIENIAIDTASTKNVAVFIWSDDKTNAVGDLVYITDVKLAVGVLATPFVPRPIGQELALAKRYCERFGEGVEFDVIVFNYASAGQSSTACITYTSEKHHIPSVTIMGTWALINTNGSQPVGNYQNTRLCMIYTVAGATAGLTGARTNSADDFVLCVSEL